jgi:hypothetical protein
MHDSYMIGLQSFHHHCVIAAKSLRNRNTIATQIKRLKRAKDAQLLRGQRTIAAK